MNTRRISQPNAEKKLLIRLHAGFFLIGIITVLLGQILPFLSNRLSLNDREAGYLFVAQFAGSLLGTFFYNQTIKKFGYKKMLFGSFCLMAGGCAALNFDSLIFSLTSIFLYGFGIGLSIPAINLLVIELNREKPASAVNIINFFWGLGAIFCKPFVDFVGSPNNFLLPTVLLSILFLLSGLTIVFSDYLEDFIENKKTSSPSPVMPIWTTKTAWLIAVFNFVQIGIESSVGGWITTFESRLSEPSTDKWISAAVIFFFFLVFGRGIAPLFFRFLHENTVLFLNLIVMTVGAILILWAVNTSYLIFGAAILGFGCSSVFPINMSRFTKKFGARATERAAPIFILGTLGGVFMTWFIGFISTAFNDLRAGFAIILIGCLLLFVLQTALVKRW